MKTEKTSFECGRVNMTRAEDSKHNFKFRLPNSGAALNSSASRKMPSLPVWISKTVHIVFISES